MHRHPGRADALLFFAFSCAAALGCSTSSESPFAPARTPVPPAEARLEPPSPRPARVDPAFASAIGAYAVSVRGLELTDATPARIGEATHLFAEALVKAPHARSYLAVADAVARLDRASSELGTRWSGWRPVVEDALTVAAGSLMLLAQGPYAGSPGVFAAASELSRMVRMMGADDRLRERTDDVVAVLAQADRVLERMYEAAATSPGR